MNWIGPAPAESSPLSDFPMDEWEGTKYKSGCVRN